MFALPAMLVMSRGKWIAVGVVVLVLLVANGGMFAWAKVEGARADSAEAQRHEAETARDFYKADSDRWQAANAEQVKVNAANIATFEAARADLARSAASAIEAAQQAEQLAQSTQAQLAKLRGKANATPGNIHPVGPLVHDGLEWLRCQQQAGPGANPGACPGAGGTPAN